MANLIQTTDDGRIVAHMIVPDSEVELYPGMTLIEGEIPPGSTHLKNGIFSREDRELTWIDQRISAYPSIRDQLDAIWKGGDSLDQMREAVLAVKAKYPKPSN